MRRRGEAFVGPSIEPTFLKGVIGELARVMIQIGDTFCAFLPNEEADVVRRKLQYMHDERRWLRRFYGATFDPDDEARLQELLRQADEG